jgi:ribulose-5-phosphate 4-epimerase/fuculose-1-phosphate aldolase
MLEQFSRFGRELSLLENYKAAVVRGRGSFAVDRMLEGAFQWTSSLEASCKTRYLYRLLSPGDKEEGKGKW